MQLKSAIALYLESKKELTSYATYKACSKYLEVTVNLKTIDLAGDLLTSARTKRIRKTKDMFEKVEHKLRKKSQNTKFFTINMLKSVLRMVENTDGSRFWSAYKVDQEMKDIVILDIDFAKDFVVDNHNFYDTMGAQLKAVWELSAVMLTTTLRISDAMALTSKDLDSDGRITIKNQKTGALTSCPVPKSLFDKLMANQKRFGRLFFRQIDKWDAYRLLPKLFILYPETIDIKDTVKFHVFRKTAISVMLAMNVPQSIVMRASGHAVGSKAFARYVGHVETMFNSEITNFQSKFYS